MRLLGKTHQKHPGDLSPTVPDMPLHPLSLQPVTNYTAW